LGKNIAILINPKAGKGHSNRLATWMGEQLILRQMHYQVFDSQWPEEFDLFSDIWILGGDGTINYFINYYPDCKIPLALFKAGTGNDFAWKLYGDLTNHEIFDRVLSVTPRPVNIGKCNDLFYINSLGIGFDGEILRSMGTIRILGGHLGYLIAVLIKIFGFREKS